MEPVAIGRQHLQQDAELGSGLKEAEVVHDAGVGEGLQQADFVLWLSHDQMVEDPANPPPPMPFEPCLFSRRTHAEDSCCAADHQQAAGTP